MMLSGEKKKSMEDETTNVCHTGVASLLVPRKKQQQSCSPVSQLTPIIHGFHVYEFAYSLKFICYSQINTLGTFVIKRNLHSKS